MPEAPHPPRLLRQESAEAAFILVEGAPDPRLRRFVRRYAGFREEVAGSGARVEPPTPKAVLIVNFGAPFEIDYPDDGLGWRRQDSFVAGFGERRAANRGTGLSHCLQVDFTPLGARLFLGLPMDALANRCAPLGDLLAAGSQDLRDRLAGAADWGARFALMDALLLGRAVAAERLLGSRSWQLAAWLERRLVESEGAVAIGGLAEAAGVSHRHLVAVSRAELGVAPKTYARVLRFNRAQALIAAAAVPDWARLAVEAGYYDQAHLIRDFRAMAGVTPGRHGRRPER